MCRRGRRFIHRGSGNLDWRLRLPVGAGSGDRGRHRPVDDHVREARELVAELIGSDVAQVALQPSTTYGLMQAIYGLAGGLLVSRAEFPSLTVAASRAAEALGLSPSGSISWSYQFT